MPLWITRCVCECVFSISISCTSAWSRSRFLPLKGNFSRFVTLFVTDWRGLALLTAASSCLKRSRERNQEILNLVYRINFLPLAHTASLAVKHKGCEATQLYLFVPFKQHFFFKSVFIHFSVTDKSLSSGLPCNRLTFVQRASIYLLRFSSDLAHTVMKVCVCACVC